MAFTNTEPQNHSSENTWFTPKHFIERLGPFDLDPCTVSFRPFDTARQHIEHDKGGDGLLIPWVGDVWLNPPYGKEIMPFIKKFQEHRQGAMLIFARMGSEGVQSLIRSGAYLYLLRRRVTFIQKNGKEVTNAGTDSLIAFYDLKFLNRVGQFQGVLVSALCPPTALMQGTLL